jgi:hypothetical protein
MALDLQAAICNNAHAPLTNELLMSARLLILSVAIALVGCSADEQPPPASPPTPLVRQDAANAAPANVLRASINATGIPARYDAEFDATQVMRIRERREGAAAGDAVYEYAGARLLRYAGPPLSAPGASVELAYDRQGALLSAQQGGGSPSAEEMAQIRSRAQLLRSHAVAQHAVDAHQPR